MKVSIGKAAGLKQLLEAIDQQQINRLVLTHKDRLLRFGSELIFALCEARNVQIVVVTKPLPTGSWEV